MAAEETAGRNFANGLGMGGFISFPPDSGLEEKDAQNVVDRLKKDFAGSQNAGKFTIIPGGGKWEKMTYNAQESQLLESRKWNEQEIVRLLGGAPLLVKMGLGEQNSTYASSSAFLDEYFNSTLLPFTTSIEQSITRDLIPRKQWGTLYAKHSADIILRGSPKERAETNQVLINSWQLTPNEARILEDRDTIEGGDFLSGPANGAIFDPVNGEFFIPGQKPPSQQDPDEADENAQGNEDQAATEGTGPDTGGNGDGNVAQWRNKEVDKTQTRDAQSSYKLTIRYPKTYTLDAGMNILVRGQRHQIDSFSDPDGQNVELCIWTFVENDTIAGTATVPTGTFEPIGVLDGGSF